MKVKPTVNNGVMATNVSAKALAIGTGAIATSTEQLPESALNAALAELRLLVVELLRAHPELPEAKVAKSLLNRVDTAVTDQDTKTFNDSVQSIVSIFKAIGDTVSTSQRIVGAAQQLLGAL